MKIALGSDHRGTDAVRTLVEHLRARGHEPKVLGDDSGEPTDYPDSAYAIARAVERGDADYGVLVCGSGIGMSIAANKVPGIRAGLVSDAHAAEMTRRHNDANVLCLSAPRLDADELRAIIDAFLDAEFEGGRHQRRIDKIGAIERGQDPTNEGDLSYAPSPRA